MTVSHEAPRADGEVLRPSMIVRGVIADVPLKRDQHRASVVLVCVRCSRILPELIEVVRQLVNDERVEKVVRFPKMRRVQEKGVCLYLGNAKLGVGVGHETRIAVRKGAADLLVEQLRIDRPADVDQFALL
jgi:hypothetical protein